MRKILFRGLRADGKGWVYGDMFRHSGRKPRTYISNEPPNVFSVKPETVGQFTGLVDKNGKEIYEGDKLRADNFEKTMAVIWRKDLASFALTADGWMYDHYFGEGADAGNCEVIGNIHEIETPKQ
jgi:uncharacterized phage protein (TIGR01671 family)